MSEETAVRIAESLENIFQGMGYSARIQFGILLILACLLVFKDMGGK